MRPALVNTPARILRRAFFLGAATAVAFAAAQTRSPEKISQIGKPSQEEAARFLDEFRRSGMPDQYYFEFELHALPRRGESRVFTGRMWGGENRNGSINRIEVVDGEGKQHRILVQGGPNAAVWRVKDGVVQQLPPESQFEPLIPGVEVTAFDLQRAYLYWPDATLQSIHRVLGRPAYAYVLRPPEGFSSGEAGITSVRAYFDTQYKQPLQSELLDADGRVRKTFSVVSLKTVDIRRGGEAARQTLPKEVDFRNDLTRDKTRLAVTAVAFDLRLTSGMFQPERLAGAIPAPPAEALIRIQP